MGIIIKRLETFEDKLEAERLIATSFLHEWDEKEAKESAKNPHGEVWAAYNDEKNMVSAVSTIRKDIVFEGDIISGVELHMVGTLPEARGGGVVRRLMDEILHEYKNNGDLFTFLIPFSFRFYRQFGFEKASEILVQKADVEQFKNFRQEMSASRIDSQSKVDEAHSLYDSFAKKYNLSEIKGEEHWKYKDNGEFGFRDWEHEDKTHYSYLFRDEEGNGRAYFTFVFVHGPEGPFVGTMKVTELIFDSPKALENVFGFFYGMRAKITDVSVELPRDIDLSIMLEECDDVKRSLDGHIMARALNLDKILNALRQPEGKGKYSIHISDDFLGENTATYAVEFENGKTVGVDINDDDADLEISVETFCQLSVGLIDFEQVAFRKGTKINGNNNLLRQVFVKKPLFLY